ncbi:sterol 14-demethylase, partial [Tanacetum coccineum]
MYCSTPLVIRFSGSATASSGPFHCPEVSGHFFKASETDLSQQEVYQFNVPTFGPGVVFDVDYSVRQEQFRFFTEALRVTKLKGYVDMMVSEAE